MSTSRKERRSGLLKETDDKRTEFRRDRDRLLYSQAFRRLSGVTQVVCPQEGSSLHNRLMHSLKVGQVSRGLADYLLHIHGGSDLKNQLDADVAEFSGMAHDLGHPPFGHAAEDELQDILLNENTDSFEGNAQSFRILTRLAGAYNDDEPFGLDVTRASLQAILKYPYQRKRNHSPRQQEVGSMRAMKLHFGGAMEIH